MPKVLMMGIDKNIELLSGSIHRAIRIDIKIDPSVDINQANVKKQMKLDAQRDMAVGKCKMAILKDELTREGLNLNKKCIQSQSLLIEDIVEHVRINTKHQTRLKKQKGN